MKIEVEKVTWKKLYTRCNLYENPEIQLKELQNLNL